MRRFPTILILAALVASLQLTPVPAIAEEMSEDLHAALRAPIAKRMKELQELKDEQGARYVFGSYYEDFTPVGDDYQVTFIKRTSNPGDLVAERYTVTLSKEGSAWKIADEKLEHQVEGILFRSTPGDETFHRFESVGFDREGLTLRGGGGDLMVDYRRGEPFRLVFRADGMRFDYNSPVELGWYQHVLQIQLKKHPKDIVFPPEYAYLTCSPAQCKSLMSEMFVGLSDASYDQMSAETKKGYDEFKRDLVKNRKEYPLAGYQVVNRPGAENWSLSIKRKGRDHWANLSYYNERRNEMSYAVTALGDKRFYGYPLFVYNSEDVRNSDVDPYEIEQKPDPQNMDYDVVGLTGSVEMALKDDEMMSCDFTYELEAKRDLPFLPFYVAQAPRQPGQDTPNKTPTLNVFAMEDDQGNDLTYVRMGQTRGLIVFPEILPAGERIKVRIKFDNGNSIYKHNHSYSRVNRSGWAPFVTFSDNIEYLDLEVTVDAKYQILGIDNKISEKVAGERRTARYRSDFPLTFPTIIFGDYESDSSSIQATKLDGTPIPVNVYVDKTSMRTTTRTSGSGAQQVRHGAQSAAEQYRDEIQRSQSDSNMGVRDIRGDALQPIADQAVNAINLYREIYGVDYPFAKLDLVCDPLGSFYGQAPPSIVYLGFGVFYPTARVNVRSRGDISSFQNTVVAHELGHQWWGSAVVNKNFGNYWFVETLAEYSSALYSEELARFEEKSAGKKEQKARAAYMKSVEEWRRVLMDRPDMFTSVQHADQMFPGGDPGTRTAAIYNKGPYAIHMLRLLFGDERFFRFLKELAQTFEGKEIVTRDIQMVAERALCGVDDQGNPCTFDLDWFFDQWIRGVGLPEYSFHFTYRQAEDGNWIVEGDIKQRVVLGADKVELPGTSFRGRTSVTVVDKKGVEYSVPVVINGPVTPFAFKVPKEPLDVVLNKNGGMLAHDVLINRDF